MGYPYHELVPVAMLWDNPGVNKEELSALFGEFKGGEFEVTKYDRDRERWDHHYTHVYERTGGSDARPEGKQRLRTEEEKREIRNQANLVRWDLKGYQKDSEGDIYPFHQGIYGLAQILNLECRSQFETEMRTAFPAEKNEFGLYYNDVTLFPFFKLFTHNGKKSLFMDLSFTGPAYLENKSKFARFYVSDEKKKGDIVDSCELDINAPYALIEKTVKTHRRKNGRIRSQAMQVRGIRIPTYEYSINVEELVKEYPFFAAERMFNFSQQSGTFSRLDDQYEREAFQWVQKDGRYYLDVERMMSNIRSGDLVSKGYADLIVTREAVRNKAWKLLTYRGLTHLECFFEKFPSAKTAYDKSVVDSHTSLYAKEENMNHNELMRLRLLGPVNEEIRRSTRMLKQQAQQPSA